MCEDLPRVKSDHNQNPDLKRRIAVMEKETDEARTAPGVTPLSNDEVLKKVERRTKRKVYEGAAVTGNKAKHVESQIKKLKLSETKSKQLEVLSAEIFDFVQIRGRGNAVKKSIQSRMESLLVEWGVAANVAAMTPDYHWIARLLAAATVAAE